MREELHSVAVEVDEKASGAIVASHELLVRGALEQSAAAQSEVARLQGSVDEVSSGAAAVEDAIEQGLKLLQEQVSAPPRCLPPRRRTAAPPHRRTAAPPHRRFPAPPASPRDPRRLPGAGGRQGRPTGGAQRALARERRLSRQRGAAPASWPALRVTLRARATRHPPNPRRRTNTRPNPSLRASTQERRHTPVAAGIAFACGPQPAA